MARSPRSFISQKAARFSESVKLQNPVDPDRDVTLPCKKAAEKLLADQDKAVKDLVEDGIKKKDAEDPDKGCDG